jgi:UDP-N-acetylmuramyl tripeptide synthase
MRKSTVIIGKTARVLARLRGGGSALPGLMVEKIDPNFLADVLGGLPRGVVVISGTNGKTTTTKMVVELLESAGLRVFTNRTGSNFTRGVVSAMLGEIRGFRLDADIAVLELDEAHAVQFVRQVKPAYALLLNVLRDQLDRFGEIDKTAKLLSTVAENTTRGVVLNRDDPLVASIKTSRKIQTEYFGYNHELAGKFPNDDELYKSKSIAKSPARRDVDVELTAINGHRAEYKIDGKLYKVSLQLNGAHNILNAAAALATARLVLGKTADISELLTALARVQPAFGRGESVTIDGQDLELILVKNPSGFRSGLLSQFDKTAAIMIAINDHYADGRDMSWLWDVDFTGLDRVSVVSGIRAYDMALRLQYDGIGFDAVDVNLRSALGKFLSANPGKPKQIFCTYTAMLKLRKLIGKIAKIEDVL